MNCEIAYVYINTHSCIVDVLENVRADENSQNVMKYSRMKGENINTLFG